MDSLGTTDGLWSMDLEIFDRFDLHFEDPQTLSINYHVC